MCCEKNAIGVNSHVLGSPVVAMPFFVVRQMQESLSCR